jgi:plasmid stabilization system protein ParE
VKVEWAEDGRAHLARIFEFNIGRSEAWAETVERRLRERAHALSLTSFIGRPVPKSTLRALSIPDIQYVIIYRVGREQVTILRVHSTRENRA